MDDARRAGRHTGNTGGRGGQIDGGKSRAPVAGDRTADRWAAPAGHCLGDGRDPRVSAARESLRHRRPGRASDAHDYRTLAGIITESDIFRAFASLFSSDEAGARITFDATQGEDVFELLGKLSKRHHLKVSSLIWTQHDELPVCVVRVAGGGVEEMLEELWSSGHPVVNVIRFAEKDKTALPLNAVPPRPAPPKPDSSSELYPST